MTDNFIKYFACLICCFTISFSIAKAQTPVMCFDKNCIDTNYYATFAHNKIIPTEIKTQVLIALSCYPELNDTKIIFRFREKVTPLSSRPKFTSAFKNKQNRTYVITISTKSNNKFSPIIFSKLPFNAQIGVLGHELAHVADFNSKSSTQLIGLSFKMFNTKFVDHFEFNTDHICINHGLGYQLYDWSKFVRIALNIKEWKGAEANYSSEKDIPNKQRYMNPETIEKYIASNVIYQSLKIK